MRNKTILQHKKENDANKKYIFFLLSKCFYCLKNELVSNFVRCKSHYDYSLKRRLFSRLTHFLAINEIESNRVKCLRFRRLTKIAFHQWLIRTKLKAKERALEQMVENKVEELMLWLNNELR